MNEEIILRAEEIKQVEAGLEKLDLRKKNPNVVTVVQDQAGLVQNQVAADKNEPILEEKPAAIEPSGEPSEQEEPKSEPVEKPSPPKKYVVKKEEDKPVE